LTIGCKMFTIIFENETYKQWSCEFIFNDFETAKKYLTTQSFVEKNRIFERTDYNWCKYVKAYISPVKIFQG
jgi:hypothetical protein